MPLSNLDQLTQNNPILAGYLSSGNPNAAQVQDARYNDWINNTGSTPGYTTHDPGGVPGLSNPGGTPAANPNPMQRGGVAPSTGGPNPTISNSMGRGTAGIPPTSPVQSGQSYSYATSPMYNPNSEGGPGTYGTSGLNNIYQNDFARQGQDNSPMTLANQRLSAASRVTGGQDQTQPNVSINVNQPAPKDNAPSVPYSTQPTSVNPSGYNYAQNSTEQNIRPQDTVQMFTRLDPQVQTQVLSSLGLTQQQIQQIVQGIQQNPDLQSDNPNIVNRWNQLFGNSGIDLNRFGGTLFSNSVHSADADHNYRNYGAIQFDPSQGLVSTPQAGQTGEVNNRGLRQAQGPLTMAALIAASYFLGPEIMTMMGPEAGAAAAGEGAFAGGALTAEGGIEGLGAAGLGGGGAFNGAVGGATAGTGAFDGAVGGATSGISGLSNIINNPFVRGAGSLVSNILGGGGSSPTSDGISDIIGGALGLNADNRTIQDYNGRVNSLINQGDFNSQYRPGYLNSLAQSYTNPDEFLAPYAAGDARDQENLRRRLDSLGYNISGNELGDLTAQQSELRQRHLTEIRNDLRSSINLGDPSGLARAGIISAGFAALMQSNRNAAAASLGRQISGRTVSSWLNDLSSGRSIPNDVRQELQNQGIIDSNNIPDPGYNPSYYGQGGDDGTGITNDILNSGGGDDNFDPWTSIFGGP